MQAGTFRFLLHLWPPFLANPIRLLALGPAWDDAHGVLRLRPRYRNSVRTQFGGNLFAMADPCWMLMIIHRPGSEYQGASDQPQRRRTSDA